MGGAQAGGVRAGTGEAEPERAGLIQHWRPQESLVTVARWGSGNVVQEHGEGNTLEANRDYVVNPRIRTSRTTPRLCSL